MGRIYKFMGDTDSARSLWENKESLDKYLKRLKELMMADPEARMTEDETKEQATERARIYNLAQNIPEKL